MLALGLVMVLLGALLVVIGLFTGGHADNGTATLLGLHIGTNGVFIAGIIAALLILVGLSFTRWGAALGWRRRKERKQYSVMAKQFEREANDDD
ncbi:hypothetical protein [Nocardioides sp. Kera G14]|uniref:hypothetical protein n=1 Tax=Nocardioides sp. Kera G14 TaxID=2884264 RepID=UPI001D10144F|nr:hypothetical protein [Nocardioides sp. Kera G14]UDY23810.1 hypothetical protein LH076_00490 [Nocardioides sp. Kera G14]